MFTDDCDATQQDQKARIESNLSLDIMVFLRYNRAGIIFLSGCCSYGNCRGWKREWVAIHFFRHLLAP